MPSIQRYYEMKRMAQLKFKSAASQKYASKIQIFKHLIRLKFENYCIINVAL